MVGCFVFMLQLYCEGFGKVVCSCVGICIVLLYLVHLCLGFLMGGFGCATWWGVLIGVVCNVMLGFGGGGFVCLDLLIWDVCLGVCFCYRYYVVLVGVVYYLALWVVACGCLLYVYWLLVM